MEALQRFFAGASEENGDEASVLMEWKEYAHEQDIEAGENAPFLQGAASKFSESFGQMSAAASSSARNLSDSAQSLPSSQQLMQFGGLLLAGSVFLLVSFFVGLPFIILSPSKFAISFTVGCLLVMGAFAALRGWKQQFDHLISPERRYFTFTYVGSMVATLYSSLILHSYIFSILCSVIQVLSLVYYVASYFPGGAAGMQFFGSLARKGCLSCFEGIKGLVLK